MSEPSGTSAVSPTTPPSGPSGHTSPTAQPAAPSPTERSSGRAVWMTLFLLLVFAGLGGWGAWWYLVLRFEESTDDAYVAGNVVRIMPRVSGRVVEVLADDTDQVRAGQVLVRLDPTDAQSALDRAVVDLAVTTRELCRLRAQWQESKAQVDAANITLQQSAANLQRREVLGRKNAVRVEELHDNRAQVQQATAQREAARQRMQALAAQLLDGGQLAEQPRIRQAAAVVRECWLAYERTTIRSPLSGQIAQRAVQPGVVVAPGTPLMAVIPLDSVWVDANFKEVQLRSMRIGQPASVRVDLHGTSVVYTGRVAGIAAGTGSVFSLIPPQNATGNWIKVVQRVPVRIVLDRDELARYPLLMGLSSVVTIDIADTSGPLLRKARTTQEAQEAPPHPQRALPALRTEDAAPDMTLVEDLIARTIADNTLPQE